MQPARTIQRRQAITCFKAKLHPVLQSVFENRGITDKSELTYDLSKLLSPQDMGGIDQASKILCDAIVNRAKILIVGDYDVDGATACATAIKGIRLLGNKNVDYLVPNRLTDGYGLSEKIADQAIALDPDLVITVDNGIASVEGVKRLRDASIVVIVTDHHLPGESLPPANAIVNPNQPGCNFASKALAGVGVMFYLLLAVRSAMRALGLFGPISKQPNMSELLDLVALGTVADMVSLDYNNRILVAHGIARIRAGKACPGITALLDLAGRDYTTIVSSDFGFVVAPRLNAAGRLDDISSGIECLLTSSTKVANKLANQLDKINRERREIEAQMQQQAMAFVHQQLASSSFIKHADSGICLFEPGWHQGVAGLVASRVKEKIGCPVIVFARSEGGQIKGSIRSVPGVHIRDLLESISIEQPGLMIAFGGHAMAAGVTIAESDYQQFSQIFHRLLKVQMRDNHIDNALFSDGQLEGNQFSLQLAEVLRNAAPWGQSFPAPRFDGLFKVIDQRILGEQHLKLTLQAEGVQSLLNAIHFRFVEAGKCVPDLKQVRLLYQLEVNQFRGKRSLQLIVDYLEVIE